MIWRNMSLRNKPLLCFTGGVLYLEGKYQALFFLLRHRFGFLCFSAAQNRANADKNEIERQENCEQNGQNEEDKIDYEARKALQIIN